MSVVDFKQLKSDRTEKNEDDQLMTNVKTISH